MTKLEVIIRPEKLEDVKAALKPWINGMTLSEVRGYARQRGHTELYRGSEYAIEFQPKYKLEIYVPSGLVPRAIHEIERAARTGKIGDGKVFVSPVEGAVRIRTGEQGDDAL